jgi:hypothetical protein
VYIYVCVCVYIYIHTHTHTHRNCVDHCLLFAAVKPNGDYFMIYARAGQLQPTLEPCNSLRTRLWAVLVYLCISKSELERGLNYLEGRDTL